MPDYYNPYRRTSSSNRYADLGGGYRQDLTTGQVERLLPDRPYRKGGYQQVEDKTEDIYEKRFAQANQFKRELSQYDAETEKFKQEALRSYQTSSDYQGARAASGLNMAANQFAQRRGLGDEFAAAITAEQAGQMRQQIVASNLDFESKLTQLLGAERIGFIKGEFDVMHRLQAMDYAHELSKDMARYQADLANDFSFNQMMGDLLEVGGLALGLSFGGPAAAAGGPAFGTFRR